MIQEKYFGLVLVNISKGNENSVQQSESPTYLGHDLTGFNCTTFGSLHCYCFSDLLVSRVFYQMPVYILKNYQAWE